MTENKRFMINDDTECPVMEGKFELSREEVVDLLNKQDEYLNILRDELELADKQNTSLEKRNDQLKHKVNGLKSELSIWKKDVNEHIQETNKLFEENKQLKKEFNKLKHRHSLLHDICIEAEFDRDWYHKDVVLLEKENKQLKEKIKELEGKNNKLRQDNNLDTIFGISDEELTKKFESAINRDKKICKSKGLPIAGYDNKNKCAYLEYPDGNKEYIKDLKKKGDFE